MGGGATVRKTLEDIRADTLYWLDQPHGEQWKADDYTRLDQLINEAYQHLVHVMDQSAQPWNVPRQSDVISITMIAGTREYLIGSDLESARDIRHVLEVVEINSDGTHSPPLDMVPWADRNRGGRRGVYVFRDPGSGGVGGHWMIGSVYVEPPWTTLGVFALPGLKVIPSTSDHPVALPIQFHELIVYRTAMLAMMQSHRGERGQAYRDLAGLYAEGLATMKAGLSTGGRLRSKVMR